MLKSKIEEIFNLKTLELEKQRGILLMSAGAENDKLLKGLQGKNINYELLEFCGESYVMTNIVAIEKLTSEK